MKFQGEALEVFAAVVLPLIVVVGIGGVAIVTIVSFHGSIQRQTYVVVAVVVAASAAASAAAFVRLFGMNSLNIV